MELVRDNLDRQPRLVAPHDDRSPYATDGGRQAVVPRADVPPLLQGLTRALSQASRRPST
ncbi:MAG TPA: hypothetical protein VN520_08300 [Streptomyces sp.]|uniref:hypothetical protein n=1 Tax=Streptomyces sp. TaxID=1931 RepID=UPI002CA3FFB9|nr:hypothetical protein [Streptomyces sp.]HWU06368.1 hypothetical protein [Streptomyces sp.]